MITAEQIIAALDAAGESEFEDVLRGQFATLREEMPRALSEVLRGLHAGDLDAAEAATRSFDLFADGHSGAAYLGRRWAGNDLPFGDFDVEFGKLVADGQAPFIEGFIADVESGKYSNDDGSLKESALELRADFYQERLRGTANEAWAGSLSLEELINWILGGDEDSACTVCPDLADKGPYKPNEMPTWPGACETPCNLGCRCTVETQSGQQGF